MKKAIIGAGGFAREVKAQMGIRDIPFFVDDWYYNPTKENIGILSLSSFNPSEYEVIVAIGNPDDRMEIVTRLPRGTKYFTFIHPTAQILGNDVAVGQGSIICAGVIVTTNVCLGRHTHLNLNTSIGHDCRIGDYFTTAPGVGISGNNTIGNRVYFGTNASTREKINICSDVTFGLNAGVVKDVTKSGIYGGTPVKLLR